MASSRWKRALRAYREDGQDEAKSPPVDVSRCE
jgi:hypothetical protein